MNMLEKINAEIAELNAQIAALEVKDNNQTGKRGRGRPPMVEDKEFIEAFNAYEPK